MCGLVAMFGVVDPPLLRRMTERLHHRGPDGMAVAFEGSGGVGHTRLSLIDFDGGAQPLRSRDGARVLAFNGEIYNHVELRRELIDRGATFTSRCDTEVVLAAYEAWGPSCVARFDGMFAFAVLDASRLVVARDRFGIKPLYVAPSARRMLFASEMAALLADPEVSARIDRRAVLEASILGYPLGERTHFASIERVPPGAVIEVTLGADGAVASRTIFALPAVAAEEPAAAGSPDDARTAARCAEILEEQVRLQRIADHPVGVLLSGGIDSSIIAAIAARQGGELFTFTLGTQHDEEFDMAAAVARAVGSEHEARIVGFDDCLAVLPRTIASLARPTSFSLVETATARMRTRVKAVLCGDGADELYGGYLAHIAPDAWVRFVRARFERARAHAWTAGETSGLDAFFAELGEAGTPESLRSAVYRAFLENQLSVGHLERWDHLSMADGLEVRVPYLCQGLAALRAGLAWPSLIDATGGKRIVKEVGLRLLPPSVAEMIVKRRKRPFWEATGGLYAAFKAFVASTVPRDHVEEHPFRHAFDGVESLLLFDVFALVYAGHRGDVPPEFHVRDLYAERWGVRDIVRSLAA